VIYSEATDRFVDEAPPRVLLYVKAELNASNFMPRTKFPEQVWCKIVNSCGAELLIGACYRSDNKNKKLYPDGSHAVLRNLIDEVNPKIWYCLVILIIQQWQNRSALAVDTDETTNFLNCIDDNYCTQHVTVPTREQNILDLIISSDHQLVNEVQVLDRFDTSDHNTISAELNFSQKIVASSKTRYDYNRADWNKIRDQLLQVDWEK